MYNLLAIVVSVAIGVFMTAAGLFYSGSAFTTASGKAQAMQIINAMEQIDAAWTMWSNDGNTTTTTNPTITGVGSLTASPYYLSSYPPAPSIATTSGIAATAAYVLDRYGTGGATPVAGNETTTTGIAMVLSATTGGNACLEMARASGLVQTTATFASTGAITVSGQPMNLNTGISLAAEFNALASVYRYFCVPLGSPGANAIVIGNTAIATTPTDDGKYLAFFKHQ